jgi:cell shape-determining protein MreD
LIIIHWVSGATLVSWKNAVSPLLGMMLWPWLYVLLDMARLRARERT